MPLLRIAAGLCALAFCLVIDYYMNHAFHRLKEVCGPIQEKPLPEEPQHQTREAFPGAKHRVYIVAGGSGFIGSWLVRYLLLRKEKPVIIIDRMKPPQDLIKHGAIHIGVDVTHPGTIENKLNQIATTFTTIYTKIIIYSCLTPHRYDLPSFSRLDIGMTPVEMLINNLQLFSLHNVVFIHIGDSMSHRKPVSWLSMRQVGWVQSSRSDTAQIVPWGILDKSQAFSLYAWSQGAVESLVRSSSRLITGAIRTEGFVSGHAGDGFLAPALQLGRGLLHSWGVPISIVHVEDVVRAALALEYLLLDPKTRNDVDGSAFSVGGWEITTLERVYEYLAKKTQGGFHPIRIAPFIVYLFGCFISCISTFFRIPSAKSIHGDRCELDMGASTNILCGSPKTLTLARFSTLQIAQLPNTENQRRVEEVLKFKPNFSLSQTLDMVTNEVQETKRRLKTSKKG